MLSPLNPNTMINVPMNVPRTWNSPSLSVAEPRKTAAKAVSKIRVGALVVPLPRREASRVPVRAAQTPEMIKPKILIDQRRCRQAVRLRVAPDSLDLLTDRGAFDQRPERRHHQGHHDDRVGNAQEPTAQRQLQNPSGTPATIGTPRIGEGKPDDDRADAERRDHRVHSKFRDDEAIDDADQRAERSTMAIASPLGSLSWTMSPVTSTPCRLAA